MENDETDGVTDRVGNTEKDRERERGGVMKQQRNVWSLVWLILIMRFGRNCLVIVRHSSFLPVAQYTIPSSTSLYLFCNYDSQRH